MKSLYITNRKGGVGKTTIALHAAWYFAERYRVLFVELDDQRNSSFVLKEHDSGVRTSQLLAGKVDMPTLSKPGISLIAADDDVKKLANEAQTAIPNLRTNVLSAAPGFDVCVIDSAPAATALTVGPLLFVTHAIAPVELSTFSLQGISSLLQSVVAAKKQYNPGLDFLGLLPNKFVPNMPAQRNGLEAVMKLAGNEFMFDGILTQRQAYLTVAEDKQPAWTDTKTASREAGKEIRSVMQKIENRMFHGRAA